MFHSVAWTAIKRRAIWRTAAKPLRRAGHSQLTEGAEPGKGIDTDSNVG